MANQLKEAFQYSMNELKKEYQKNNNEDEFTMWFNMNYVEDTIDTITISVASPFMKQMMDNKGCFTKVQNKLQEITGQSHIKLNCIIKAEKLAPSEDSDKSTQNDNYSENATDNISDNSYSSNENKSAENNSEKKAFKKHPLLNENFTFDTFIPGENSDYAYKASIAVAENPGKQYNPLLLYGGSGLGKTHLMQAIGNYINNNGGSKLKICYVSAETFTNEFISSVRNKKTDEFKSKYRNLDVLLLDDIHFLSEKESTQEELFYTFNALHEKNSQMIFTCDRPIKEIKFMADRLVSRLSNGLCIDITIPNFETRCAILQKKIEQKGKILSNEIIEYIARNVETNVRELEAALNKVFGYSELIGEKLSLDMVKKLLQDLFTSNNKQNISLETIQKVIADNYNISVAELKGKKRDKKFVIPRQISIYISRELTEISYMELGKEYGGKDHTTIMHSYEKVAEMIKLDPSLESKIQLFIKEIKEFKE